MATQRALASRDAPAGLARLAQWLVGGLAGLVLASSARAQTTDGWLERVRTAEEALDPTALAALQDELATRDEPEALEALKELEHFREHTRDTVWKVEDAELGAKMALAAASLYRDEFGSAYLFQEAARRYLIDDRFEGALECLRESKRVLIASPIPPGDFSDSERRRHHEQARHSIQAALLYRRLGLLDRAVLELPILHEERDLLRKEQLYPSILSDIHYTLAELDVAQERWSELEDWLSQITDTQELDPHDKVQAIHWLGQAAFERNREDEAGVQRARARFNEVIANENAAPRLVGESHRRLARIALHRGEFEEAERRLILAEEAAFDELVPDERADHSVFEMRLARSTGRGESRARDRLFEHWEQCLQEWHDTPIRPGGIGFRHYPNHQRLLAEVLRAKLETGTARDAFAELEAVDRVSTLSRSLANRGRVAQAVQALPGELLLAFLPGPNGTHLFVLERQDVKHFLLPVGEEGLRRDIAALNRLLRQSPRANDAPPDRETGLRIQSTKLWRALIPDEVVSLLESHELLTISGIELLHHLPFECLGPESQPALGLTHDIAYLPALAQRSQLVEGENHGSTFVLMGGAAQLHLEPDWHAGLSRHYEDAQTFQGPAASGDRLHEVESVILQLFGHGQHDFARELMASVELDGGLVGYEAISRGEHAPRVAIVTACGGWRSPSRRGDGGVGHLASAFLRKGTEAVVLPYADIEVGATLAWSQVFHWALNQGWSSARAAREARIALSESERYADPFYHSLLHVVGNGHVAVLPASSKSGRDSRPAPASPRSLPWRELFAGAGLLLLVGDAWRRINRRRRHHRQRAESPPDRRSWFRSRRW